MPHVLETERLILREPKISDLEKAVAFFMTERSEGIGGPYDAGKAWRVFATECGHWALLGYGMWIVTRKGDDTPLGLIGPWTPGDWPEKEVGWSIWDENLEGTGIATEAARAAIDDAYSRLGWETVVSYVGVGNTRSARLAEKLGAVLDTSATQPVGHDVRVYRHPKPEHLG